MEEKGWFKRMEKIDRLQTMNLNDLGLILQVEQTVKYFVYFSKL